VTATLVSVAPRTAPVDKDVLDALVHALRRSRDDLDPSLPPAVGYTGAAAAAFGGYLRELGLIALPATLIVHRGDDLGRPSLLTVKIPDEPGSGIAVSGSAVSRRRRRSAKILSG
jgi:hypothetical protein